MAKPYSPLWLLFLLFSGIFDPIYGLFCIIFSIVYKLRLPGRADTPARRRRGLALILGGIEGPSPYNYNMARGLLKSGYRGAVVRDDWNAGFPFWRSLVNLISTAYHERHAARIAERLKAYRREFPDAPIDLIAQSGGCWITVRVLELLPPEVRVRSAVLIAPSISPGCDIRRAAGQCDGALISFGSAGDYFFLGLGTMLLGTSDRRFSPSAGLVGWHYRPKGFIEARWHPDWLTLGNLGNHTTSAATGFMAHVVGPAMCNPQKLRVFATPQGLADPRVA